MFPSKSELISRVRKGEVSIDGKPIVNPEFIFDPSRKEVFWGGRQVFAVKKKIYILVNKPSGYLSSRLTENDRKAGKKGVFSLFEKDKLLDGAARKSLFCVGRLDKDTSGLLMVTNDGKLGALLTNPASGIEKTYHAMLERPISDADVKALEGGVVIGLEENGVVTSYKTRGCRVVKVGLGRKVVVLALSEGRKREVRRMFGALGNEVVSLKRIGIGLLLLDNLGLAQGSYLFATQEMVNLVKAKL